MSFEVEKDEDGMVRGDALGPLRVREGVRYRCFGDGLCCTDVHAIGPLEDSEAVRLQLVDDRVTHHFEELDGYVLTMTAEGRCHFLAGDGGCHLHGALGGALKPTSCRRFPLGLVVTPTGARVTTDHRCPCRTMGERPLLTAADAEAPLQDSEGSVFTGSVVSESILVADDALLRFEEYEAQAEAELFANIRRGDLGFEPFAPLREASWSEVSQAMGREDAPSRFGAMLRAYAAAMEGEINPQTLADRPWRDAFARAEARSPHAGDPEAMRVDWLLDWVWGLYWTQHTSLERVRRELATRVRVVERLEAALGGLGVRPDRATAEAIAIAELVGTSELWEAVTADFVT